MHHQSETVKLFTINSNSVEVHRENLDFHFEPTPSSNNDCDEQECETCVFSKAKSCYITPNNEDYFEILDYFKTYHPEKLL